MKDRIFEVMKMVGKTPTDFANTIEISPAVLSSIKSGRTKPTLFLVEKIKSVYPNININWLITGEGEMFTDREQHELSINNEQKAIDNTNIDMLSEPEVTMKVENKQQPVKPEPMQEEPWQVKTVIKPDDRKISQIIVLYNDGTFETLTK